MIAHKIETVVPPHGTLQISDLPFSPGEQIEIIVLKRENIKNSSEVTFPLRGTFGEMRDPFEPAAEPDDWDAMR